jgi:hypothetical protein
MQGLIYAGDIDLRPLFTHILEPQKNKKKEKKKATTVPVSEVLQEQPSP